MKIDITFEQLEETIREYFKDFFDKMWFITNDVLPILDMRGERKNMAYSCTFSLIEWDSHIKRGLEFHILENIKGELIRSEQKILLEHQKAAE